MVVDFVLNPSMLAESNNYAQSYYKRIVQYSAILLLMLQDYEEIWNFGITSPNRFWKISHSVTLTYIELHDRFCHQ